MGLLTVTTSPVFFVTFFRPLFPSFTSPFLITGLSISSLNILCEFLIGCFRVYYSCKIVTELRCLYTDTRLVPVTPGS